MAVPKYYEMYAAFLGCLSDGKSHPYKEIKEAVATEMKVTSEERKTMLPSGKQTAFDNRVGWARTYLKKAGLIDSPARAVFVITKEGQRVLREKPAVLDDNYLKRYPSFCQFKNGSTGKTQENSVGADLSDGTPDDVFDEAFQQINNRLADDLLSLVMKQSPEFFEQMVVDLLLKMGYGGLLEDAGTVTARSRDEGIDGIIREDKLGVSHIYIQAKRWDTEKTIGRPEIQKFVGALAGHGATKGLFITTAAFSRDAIQYAGMQHTTKVVLVDGKKLAQLMIDYNLGVSSTDKLYEIKKIDTDFFIDEESL